MISLARITLFAATAGALLVSVATALGRVESRLWALTMAVGYVALVGLGLRKPSLRMFTDALATAPEGASIVVETELDATQTDALLRAFEQRDSRATLAVRVSSAVEQPEVVRDALARGHSFVVRDSDGTSGTSGTSSSSAARMGRSRANHTLFSSLERDELQWNERLPDRPMPELWLSDRRYTPVLQRLADAFDRTLVAPSVDLRARAEGEPLNQDALVEQLTDALGEGAIALVSDTPALRAALPAVLDAAARLGVPVRALCLPSAER
jgi:hypothetical protein